MPRAIVPYKGLRRSSQAAQAIIDAQQAIASIASINTEIERLWWDEEQTDALAQQANDYAVAAQQAIAQLEREVDSSFDTVQSRVDGVVADLADFVSVADVTYATKQEVDEATGTITQTIEANYATKEENNASTAPNLTPFYECAFDQTSYWKDYGNGYCTRLTDGWAKVVVNNTTSGDVSVPAFTAPLDSDDVNALEAYTLLVQVRNVTITKGTGVQIYGASAASGSMSQFTLEQDPFFLTARDASYLVPLKSRDASSLAQAAFGTRTYYRVPRGSQVAFEVRLALFHGSYTGMWKPYGGEVLYTTRTVLKQTSDSILQSVASNYVDKATGATLATKTEVTTGLQGVRTYVETNYALQEDLTENVNALSNYITSNDAVVAELQTQIDGAIETWFYDGVPTLSNLPASQWNTAEKKNVHLGDLYYDGQTGKAYRFQMSGSNYVWQEIADTDVARALAAARDAQDTADGKRRVFVSTPAPPYDVGDLWVQGSTGDILRCGNAKAAGAAYVAADWVKASRYTDDTKANQVATNLSTNYYTKSQQDVTDNAIKQSVEDNLTTAKTYADGLVQTEVTNRNTAIQQSAAAIELAASKTYTTKQEFNALEIGGRNLLRNTGVSRSMTAMKYGVWDVLIPTYKGYAIDLDEGEYMLSFDWEASAELPNDFFAWVGYGDADGAGRAEMPQSRGPYAGKGATSGHYVRKFYWPDANDAYPYFACRPFRTVVDDGLNGITFTITNAKLEKGNKATDWSPAPEDADATYASKAELKVESDSIKSTVSQTYQLKGDYPTKTEMNSAITQKADSIMLTVANTYATKTALSEVSQTVSGISTRVQSAEGNISTLQQTASNIQVTLGSAVSAANEALKQSKVYPIGVNDGTVGWHFLGTVTLSYQTDEAQIEIHTGAGQNNGAYQNLTIFVNLKRGYQPSTSASAGITVRYEGDPNVVTVSESLAEVCVRCTSVGVLNVYLHTPEWGWADGWYQVTGRGFSWVHMGTLLTSEPTEGTLQAVAVMNAYRTATDYLHFSSSGLDVGYSATNAKTRINSSGVYIFNSSGTQIGSFEGSTARIGPSSGWNAYINGSALQILNNGTQYAYFGTYAQVGTSSGYNVYIDSSSLSFRNGSYVFGTIRPYSARAYPWRWYVTVDTEQWQDGNGNAISFYHIYDESSSWYESSQVLAGYVYQGGSYWQIGFKMSTALAAYSSIPSYYSNSNWNFQAANVNTDNPIVYIRSSFNTSTSYDVATFKPDYVRYIGDLVAYRTLCFDRGNVDVDWRLSVGGDLEVSGFAKFVYPWLHFEGNVNGDIGMRILNRYNGFVAKYIVNNATAGIYLDGMGWIIGGNKTVGAGILFNKSVSASSLAYKTSVSVTKGFSNQSATGAAVTIAGGAKGALTANVSVPSGYVLCGVYKVDTNHASALQMTTWKYADGTVTAEFYNRTSTSYSCTLSASVRFIRTTDSGS